jgi:hypothetical protein
MDPNKFADNPQEDESLQKKAGRTAEDIKQVFINNYGFEEDDPRLDMLVEREMAHSKNVSKLIRQKINYRTLAEGKKGDDPEKEEKKSSPALEEFRTIERKKATESFLSEVAKKHNLDPQEVYEKIKGEYNESPEDVRREDFEKRLKKTFYLVYPDIYKNKVREEERKKLLEDDIDTTNVNSRISGDHKKKKENKFFVKQDPVQDWFKPKKS